jgi:pyridoxal phosphate enzyme (YggS family)
MDPRGLTAVLQRVGAAAGRAGADPDAVTLVAVSKGRPIEAIEELYDAGHRDFGENRPEELAAKAPRLPDDIRWHMVGTIQRRKAAAAAEHAVLIHSLDRDSLARRLSGLDRSPPVLVQVNLAGEAQKHGVVPEAVGGLIELARGLGLDVRGLMLIPPVPSVPEDSRRWFVGLRELRDRLAAVHVGLDELSMGMTDDFEVAVEEGASIIRVGRAIFDPQVR